MGENNFSGCLKPYYFKEHVAIYTFYLQYKTIVFYRNEHEKVSSYVNDRDNFLSTTIKIPDLDLQIEQILVFHFFIELLPLPIN
jgi:hypothetical protein